MRNTRCCFLQRCFHNRCFLYLLFFLSGASALIFEVVWQKMLLTVFGASSYSTTVILAALFTGLAAGSYWCGKLLDRVSRPMMLYGLFEGCIGLYALLVPVFLEQANLLYLWFFQGRAGELSLAIQSFRFFITFFLFLPVTFFMGATLPAMNRILGRLGLDVGRAVAAAYGVNTAGAMLGCLLSGYALIRVFGMSTTTLIAGSLSAMIALGALLLRNITAGSLEDEQRTEQPSLQQGSWNVWTSLYFVAGIVALGFEVVWFRILAIYGTNSIATFTAVLFMYLAGFATGSYLFFPWLRVRFSEAAILFLGFLGAGTVSLLVVPGYHALVESFSVPLVKLPTSSGTVSGLGVTVSEFVNSLMFVFGPSVFLGLVYPAVCTILVSTVSDLGRKSGLLYSIGTLGGAVGVIVVSLVLIPRFGLVGTLGTLAGSSGLLALSVVYLRAEFPFSSFAKMSGFLLVVLSFTYATCGMPFTALGRLKGHRAPWEMTKFNGEYHLLRYQEGTSATVSVRQIQLPVQRYREIAIDDQAVATTRLDSVIDQKMLAHLPFILHPNPKLALTVGFGSGGTSWAMTRYALEVEVVEIEKEVLRSAYLFESSNHLVLKEKNLRVIIDDARNYIRLSGKKFDVISTDVTNLQYKNNSSLYTTDYFSLLRDHIGDDGVVCAWVPWLGVWKEDFKTLLRSFQHVFPNSSLWVMEHKLPAFGLLIGTKGPLQIDYARIKKVLAEPAVGQDLSQIDIHHPEQIPTFLFLDPPGLKAFVGSGDLHTDDRPILEFTTPLSSFSGIEEGSMLLLDILSHRPNSAMPYLVHISSDERESFLQGEELSRRQLEKRLTTLRGELFFPAFAEDPSLKQDNAEND